MEWVWFFGRPEQNMDFQDWLIASEESLMFGDRYIVSVLPEPLVLGFGLNRNTLVKFLGPSFSHQYQQ